MSELNLDLSFLKETEADKKAQEDRDRALSEAAKRVTLGNETLEEAWERILAMKNSNNVEKRLLEVKERMEAGTISRPEDKEGKKFSKSEALEMWQEINEERRHKEFTEMVNNTPDNYHLVGNKDGLDVLKKALLKTDDVVGFDIETYGEKKGEALDFYKGNVAGFSVSVQEPNGDVNYYIPLNHKEKTQLNRSMSDVEIIEELREPLESIKTVMHNAGFDTKFMYMTYGIDMIDNVAYDTRIMAFMLNENETSHRLKDLVTNWLGEEADNFDELFPDHDKFNEVPLSVALVYAAGDTEKTLKLYRFIRDIMTDERNELGRVWDLLNDVEMPVQRTFIRSDLRGIAFNTELSREVNERFTKEEDELYAEMVGLLSEQYADFNPRSPVQVKEIIYDYLGLPSVRGQQKTDKDALEELSSKHEFPKLMLKYRGINKLKTSFTTALEEKAVEGRLHPEHNTLGARTGRFTCKNPK